MPDRQEVRRACYKVMSEKGWEGIRRELVRDKMRAVKVPTGSNRDLTPIIDEFKKEVSGIATTLPVAIQDKVAELARGDTTTLAHHKLIEFAKETWRFAFTAALAVPNFAGGNAEPKKPGRQPSIRPERGSLRVNNLRNVVERMLSADAPRPVREPISSIEIFRRLEKNHQQLSDEDHIARDLRRTNSSVLYRLPNGKWWRRDRPLTRELDDQKTARKAPRTNSPLSVKRQKNEPSFDEAISFMITAERPVTREEIAVALLIPEKEKKAFYQMLRNRIRTKNRRIGRDDDGNYFIEKQNRRHLE